MLHISSFTDNFSFVFRIKLYYLQLSDWRNPHGLHSDFIN